MSARFGAVHERPTSRCMPTRIVFLGGQETTVNENQDDDVVVAVRRDDPNPVKLEGTDGLVLHVNWSHVTLIAPAPEPRLPG